jgi:acyl carrier protein
MSVDAKVKEIIANQLGKDAAEVTDGASLVDDLGADSLSIVEIMMELENELGVKIPDDASDKIKTVADVVSFIEANK